MRAPPPEGPTQISKNICHIHDLVRVTVLVNVTYGTNLLLALLAETPNIKTPQGLF